MRKLRQPGPIRGHHRDSRHGGSGGGFGPRGRRGKLFDAAQIQLIVLKLIGEDSRHGYEIMRDIETRTGGMYAPSPGMIYPTLTHLEETGLVDVADSDGTRKAYRITEAGRARLEEAAHSVDKLLATLETLGSKAARADSAPVRRAMGNLREVLMTRLAKADTSDAQILEAARMIDEVAGRIERM